MQNTVFLIGRLAKEPELIRYDNGKTKTEITLAVQRQFKNSNGEYDVDFIKCTLWDGFAINTCAYLNKGDLCGVKGRLEQKNNKNEIIVEKVNFLSSKREKEEEQNLENETNEVELAEEI